MVKKTPDTRSRLGQIDAIDDTLIRGWAVDKTQLKGPATLVLLIDDKIVGGFTCTDPRPELNAEGIPGDRLGFRFQLPPAVIDGKPHRIRIRFRTGEALYFGQGEQARDELEVVFQTTAIHGVVDGMSGASVRGWAFRSNRVTGERNGNVTLEVRANGIRIGAVKATLIRNDVAEMLGCEPHCGFMYTLPTRFRDGKPFVLEFHGTPEGGQIQGSPFNGRVLTRDSSDRLFEMYAKIEALCTQVYALKDELRNMVSADEYDLSTYKLWMTKYLDTLRSRVLAERRGPDYARLMGGASSKVSVICPVYKPAVADFVAAVESVRRQSWTDWELILVDDASKSPQLTTAIDAFCAKDPRIRVIRHPKNLGISEATNAGIAAATGEWIALFDHDDLLVDVALEIMLLAARNTGAKLLYSDEDKVDQYGNLSDPHLKTDWNYRLILSNNYICHLLFVEATTLRQVGPFRPAYDGAQDHDLILRLSEAIPATQIHHVPEILYHWRKSATSTAGLQSAKSYAVEAGRKALADHLARRNLPAAIVPLFNSTLYEVQWGFLAQPKVSILIPFKDQVETTKRCVEAILKLTAYRNYEIVLIDNWSTEPKTEAWVDSIRSNKRIKIIRVEEPFNYSRINNLAANQLETDFFLFLNNDVFVQQADWLRIMVNEALADPHVGAVGAKLIYPNQTVQHAGVVLGVGGVGDHMFRYVLLDAPGYCFRAICAQDMSAVTAACMLCRADAFRAVGMFDEERFTVAFNDVDLCLRIGRAGYRIVMTPAMIAEHHESLSRGTDLAEHNLPRFYGENQAMVDRWGPLLLDDPYYNPHFSREVGMFEKLSNASLQAARAPSLLKKPVPRAVLPPGSSFPEPTSDAPGKQIPSPVKAPQPKVKPKSPSRKTAMVS